MRHYINLVNPELLPPRPFFQFRTLVLLLLLTALVLGALAAYIRISLVSYTEVAAQAQARVAARESQLREQQASLKVREKDPALAQALVLSQAEWARLEQIIAQVPGQGRGPGAAATLAALSAAVMPGVWLANIELSQGAVSLQGYALQPELIPDYLERLRAQAVFQGQQFSAFELGRKSFNAGAGTGTGTAGAASAAAPEALMFELRAASAGGRP